MRGLFLLFSCVVSLVFFIRCSRQRRCIDRPNWQIGDNKTAPPAEQFSIVNAVLIKFEGRLILQCFRCGWDPQELPMAHQIQGEKITAHAVIQSSITQNEFPFLDWADLGSALEGLQCLFAELLVKDHQGGIVREVGLGL